MALTRTQIIDATIEERQIKAKLDKMAAARDARKAQINQAASDALNQTDADYITATQAAQSRLAEIQSMLKDQAAWGDP